MDGSQPRPWDATATSSALIQSHQAGAVTFDVTADVQAFLAGAQPNRGWIVKKTEEGAARIRAFTTTASSHIPWTTARG